MKFYGNIGFAEIVETSRGIHEEVITDKKYAGDVLRLSRRRESGEHIIDGLRINTQISILCDPWFQDHFSQIRYVEYLGNKWVVETVEPNYPSILLTLGGLYNENET